MVSRSPAWAPQATLAEEMRSRSATSWGHPSPRSALMSIVREIISGRLPASRFEFGRVDRLEADPVARADGEGLPLEVDDPQRSPAEQVPAAGRGRGIDARLPAGDRDRTGGHLR